MPNKPTRPLSPGVLPAGLNRVTTNVPAGKRLYVPGKVFWLFFEEEMRARFLTYPKTSETGETGETGGDAATGAEPPVAE